MGYRAQIQAPATLLWHDYETTGLDKARDRPMQFAAIRTDANLNIIEEPTSFFCKVGADAVPDPFACLLTGISPQRCETEGVSEAEFSRKILSLFSKPGTCGVGYNTLRFDDEFTRHLLFRTMNDPYEREWSNSCSRWDIVDLVRAVYALRPSTMQWPLGDDGRVSFRLEKLAEANHLPKVRAHDALSDVETTIALARLIKERSPELYHLHFGLRLKKAVLPLFDLNTQKPLFHVSGLHGLDRACLAPVIPLAVHPSQSNVFLVFDLAANPAPLLALSPEDIVDRVFHAKPGERLPLTSIYANRAPVLLTSEQLKLVGAERVGLGFDKAACAKNWGLLREKATLVGQKVQAVYSQDNKSYVGEDPELCLYGGFSSDADRRRLQQVQNMTPQDLASTPLVFDNPNYGELLFRHRARNWPETLTAEEGQRWSAYVGERLVTGGAIKGRTLTDFRKLLSDASAQPQYAQDPMLEDLLAWCHDRQAQWILTDAPRVAGPSL